MRGRGRALCTKDVTTRGGAVAPWLLLDVNMECGGFFCGGDKKKSDKSFLIGLVVGGGNLLSHTRVQYHWRGRA